MSAKLLFDKVWDDHVVSPESPGKPAILYIDLHLVHEVTTPQAFTLLRDLGLPGQIRAMVDNCREFGVQLHGFDSDQRGFVHVIGPEIGATQPGKTIVCGDSHSSTHGAFGALAFGIGSTEVGHVMATQCLLQRKPKTMAVNIDGELPSGVTAKDIILAIIGKIGVDGGTGHVIEFRGTTVASLNMEQRMTICNMTIEAGARAGMMAPDDTTIEFIAGRPQAPTGTEWDRAVQRWLSLPSDPDASFDKEVTLDVSKLTPMVIRWQLHQFTNARPQGGGPGPEGAQGFGFGSDARRAGL
jgi:3-isopropylmalate/(R)-2-methylmalate dehydratase large subunit